jgi:Mg-chelatase subunit ChlD
MDLSSHQTTGVNGSDVYDVPVGKQQELLALFGALNRDIEEHTLLSLLDSALHTSDFVDLVVLAFHTRDIREGKGERDLFYKIFTYLYLKNPDILSKCLQLVPEYGSWLDLQKIHGISMTSSLNEQIVSFYSKQLLEDSEKEHNLTLAAKWAPREGKQWDSLAKLIAKSMYPSKDIRFSLKSYRKLLSGLNKKLNTVEIKMCHDSEGNHHFADIEPGKVPSRCLKMKRKAFYDIDKKGNVRKRSDDDSDKEDRAQCAKNFVEHIKAAKEGKTSVHGRTLMPHEFIITSRGLYSQEEKDTLETQWIDLRNSILEKGTLGKIVVMSDVSGSMSSGGKGSVKPMDVSLGLGLLCAECTAPAFRNRVLTFESNPSWVAFDEKASLFEKITTLSSAPWGGSTNFEAAMNMILDTLVKFGVPVGEEPQFVLCITDMGWDAATSSYYNSDFSNKFETHIDRIKREFNERGGWKAPTIIVWNVSGKFQQYHHESETEGVCVISGWSPAILKFIMSGENVVEKVKQITPYRIMRDILDNTRYNKIRELF